PYLTKEGFAIVCDGVGGQDGGEIASRLAIDSITAKIKSVGLEDRLNLSEVLEKSVCIANDAICDRNDSEKRQGRRRMGTTLVTAWAYEHQLHIAHIGDSRAYLITRQNCYQITLDDDVASRDVRLGYALYLDALQQVASGALVQALGITPSMNLHPTVQRFPVDEDCVFLLCSDGLSDRNRVDENWQEEILPLLEGKTDINTLREELIEIANTQNGHDNVTIALIHYQVSPAIEEKMAELDIPPVVAPSVPMIVRHLDEDEEEEDTAVFSPAGPTTKQPEVIEKVTPVKNLPKTLLFVLLGGLVIGLIGYSLKTLIPELKKAMNSGIEVGDGVTASPSIIISPATLQPIPTEMKVGEYFQVQLDQNANYDQSLVNQIDGPEKVGTLSAGSIFRVKNIKNIPVASNSPTPTISPSISPTAKPSNSPIKSEEQWLQLEVCQVTPSEKPSMGNPSPSISPSPDGTDQATPTDNLDNEKSIPVLTAGGSGWIMRSSLSGYPLQRLTNIELEKLAPNGSLGKCQLNADKTLNK
ncbi:MAG: PP2C family protein-serine/threonine phosphatase, partial [Microcoleaceae cyanobacterium]